MSNSVPDPSKEFAGRRAPVKGGSLGIGAAIAQRLLDGCVSFVVVARNRHEQTPAGVTFIKGDMLTVEGCKQLVDESVKALGGFNILVNNAAAAKLVMPNSEAISDAEWQETIASTLLSAVRATNAALPTLKQFKDAGRINISSGSDLPGAGPLAHYGASKAALNYYTKALAKELGAANKICVNTVTPGGVETPGGDFIRNELMAVMVRRRRQPFRWFPSAGSACFGHCGGCSVPAFGARELDHRVNSHLNRSSVLKRLSARPTFRIVRKSIRLIPRGIAQDSLCGYREHADQFVGPVLERRGVWHLAEC